MYVIKAEWDKVFEKCAKFMHVLLSRRSDADPMQRIWIWLDQKVPDLKSGSTILRRQSKKLFLYGRVVKSEFVKDILVRHMSRIAI
jgi:hypothetical protein